MKETLIMEKDNVMDKLASFNLKAPIHVEIFFEDSVENMENPNCYESQTVDTTDAHKSDLTAKRNANVPLETIEHIKNSQKKSETIKNTTKITKSFQTIKSRPNHNQKNILQENIFAQRLKSLDDTTISRNTISGIGNTTSEIQELVTDFNTDQNDFDEYTDMDKAESNITRNHISTNSIEVRRTENIFDELEHENNITIHDQETKRKLDSDQSSMLNIPKVHVNKHDPKKDQSLQKQKMLVNKIDNTNADKPFIRNPLETVSYHLCRTAMGYSNYIQLVNEQNVTIFLKTKAWFEYLCLKNECFDLSYSIVSNLVLPQLQNIEYIENFLCYTYRCADDICNSEYMTQLFNELITWTKQKKERERMTNQTNRNIEDNSLKQILNSSNVSNSCLKTKRMSKFIKGTSNLNSTIQNNKNSTEKMIERTHALQETNPQITYPTKDTNRLQKLVPDYQKLPSVTDNSSAQFPSHSAHNTPIPSSSETDNTQFNYMTHSTAIQPSNYTGHNILIPPSSYKAHNTSVPPPSYSGYDAIPPQNYPAHNTFVLPPSYPGHNTTTPPLSCRGHNTSIPISSYPRYNTTIPPPSNVLQNTTDLPPTLHNSTVSHPSNPVQALNLPSQVNAANKGIHLILPQRMNYASNYNPSYQNHFPLQPSNSMYILQQNQQVQPDLRSLSTDSGFMSPLNFYSGETKEPNNEQDEETFQKTPLITHVTSLNPHVSYNDNGLCYVCSKTTNHKCLGCSKIYYCSLECQRTDWPVHGNSCIKQT